VERLVLKLTMFHTLGLAVLSIYLGEWIRNKFPALKKYCLPGAVIGGTIVSIISLLLYNYNIVELSFDYKAANTLFYCIFFAASGAAASMSLLKKGGKLVIIFAILAAVLAFLQNALAIGVGVVLGVDPLVALMTGSIPMTGGHGNAAAFAPMAVQLGASNALEVALAAATFGLISGSLVGGPFGNFMIQRFHLDKEQEQTGEVDESIAGKMADLFSKKDVIAAVYYLMIACGMGGIFEVILKALSINFPIHVCCMLGGILVRLYLDYGGKGTDQIYGALDTVGEFSLNLFVSMSIISMKLWQLTGLGVQLSILMIAQVLFILPFCYFLTFRLLGKNYDAAVMAVGHTGFGLGAVPVSMTTMQTVCNKYRYSKLAFFVVPVIGGFLSNITNAIIITQFINFAAGMAK